ncbi:glycerophosphocholine acyltransferase 1-like isoform X3 [Macadamia integrifolia]|uniref:glycerophosphocholine acyltransferase 1-like isoform X3 n=1 Tax=Macadamia integrifolia TaxID=60698 RepID=UPI001C500CCD|nr:glycerophosphocholine acyltransferase 1-like isoform X3 [Macadamia integrifolia]
MSNHEDPLDERDPSATMNQKLIDRTKKVAQTREMLSKQAVQTKEILSKQAIKIAKQAEEHERFITKDFCYYANTIFLVMLLVYPRNEKLFMVCFSFAEGPLAWALIVWRCSLVFSSLDKIVSVLIHLLPGIVFFVIRWWDPATFEAMHPDEDAGHRASWPYVESKSYLWIWLFVVPLVAYTLWQILYFLIVNVLRRQRLLRDPEVMTSYRELSKKAQKANNIWWRLSGLLGDQNRMFMYILFQALFTVATMALTVPIFLSYKLHVIFQILKVSASIWNGGSFLLEVMPRQVILKEKKKLAMQPISTHPDQTVTMVENSTGTSHSAEADHS